MKKKNVVSWSGGKDSTAMLIMMLDKGIKIDEIVFIDTGAEYPAMYKHIELVEERTGIKITHLNFNHSFEFYMLDHIKTKGKSVGTKGYGWCGGLCRWGTTFKKQIFSRYIKENYDNQIVEFQGIAFDEQERLSKNKEKKWEVRYPLAEWNITESMALEYCEELGYTWEGLYRYLDRVSCWCCRNKNLKELKNIFYHMPGTWEQLKALEEKIGENYREYSLIELEERFTKEGLQLNF